MLTDYGILNDLMAIGLLIIMGFFTYVGFHMGREKDAGKYIPMFWEKEENKNDR